VGRAKKKMQVGGASLAPPVTGSDLSPTPSHLPGLSFHLLILFSFPAPYACALEVKILDQGLLISFHLFLLRSGIRFSSNLIGRLYVTDEYILFQSNLFGTQVSPDTHCFISLSLLHVFFG
jgi:hypothetical protein